MGALQRFWTARATDESQYFVWGIGVFSYGHYSLAVGSPRMLWMMQTESQDSRTTQGTHQHRGFSWSCSRISRIG